MGIRFIFLLQVSLLGMQSCFSQPDETSSTNGKPEVVITTGHVDMVNCITVSPDGKWLATGSIDKTVKIQEILTGRELRTYSGNNGSPSAIRFSPDSRMIAALFNHGEVKVWNVADGEVILQAEADENASEVDFVLNNTAVVALSKEDYAIRIYPLDGGVVRQIPHTGILKFRVDANSEHIFTYTYKGFVQKIDLKTGALLMERQLFPEFVFSPAPMERSFTGSFICMAFDDQKVHVLDAATLKTKFELVGHTTRIWSVESSNDEKHLYSVDHNGELIVWDAATGKKIRSFKPGTFSPMAMAAHPAEPFIFLPDGKDVLYVNPDDGRVLRTYKSKTNKVIQLAYNQALGQVAAATNDVKLKLWNLERGKIDFVLPGFWPVVYTPDGKYMIGMYMSIKLGVWDAKSGELLFELDTDNELIQNLSVSPDGRFVAGGGFFGILKIWDLSSKSLVQRLSGHAGGIYCTHFSPDGKKLASAGMDGTVRIWDPATGTPIQVIEQAHQTLASQVQFSPDGRSLASAGWDKMVKIWSIADGEISNSNAKWTLNKTFEGHTNMILTLDWHASGKYLATGAGNNSVWQADNSVIVWDAGSGAIKCQFTGHKGMVNKVVFDPGSEGDIISCGDDGAIRIWNFKNCKEKVMLLSVNESGHVLTTPDHYYTASKDALEGVSFRKGPQLFPFDQFDLWLNRPDIVLGALGKTPQNLINAYEFAHNKRVEKSGIPKEKLGGDFHLPVVEFVTSNIPLFTKDTLLKITINASDEKYLLQRIKVTVNDVPAGGPMADNLLDRKLKSVEYVVPVRLTPGENRISISVINEKGAESLRKTIRVLRDAPEVKGKLFLVTLGVSNYKDERFNLKYAAKDARDVAGTLAQAKDSYQSVHSLTLTDQEVTLAGLEKVRNFLAAATADDAAIIFLAGHGVLDASFNYFYAAHDMNFENPSKGGIPYIELDRILMSVKARRKLLFMDTCHSGEVDKDELVQIQQTEVRIEEVEFRNAGTGVRAKDPFGYGNSVELVQNLFSDLNTGTGATVVSSSGGVEFAMESDTWQNGLFTFALLQGLREGKADTNWDKAILLDELRKYVYTTVNEISKGAQKPGTREENISVNFRVY